MRGNQAKDATLLDPIVIRLPDGPAGSALVEVLCGLSDFQALDALEIHERDLLREHMTNARCATEHEVAAIEGVLAPTDIAAKVRQPTANEVTTLPIGSVDLDGHVLDRSIMHLDHVFKAPVVIRTNTVAGRGEAENLSPKGRS